LPGYPLSLLHLVRQACTPRAASLSGEQEKGNTVALLSIEPRGSGFGGRNIWKSQSDLG
jgi:hypothetical protein